MLTPPLRSILDILNLRTYWWRKTPWTNMLKRHIHIEKCQIECFNCSFLGWGLRVTYNWDIFGKLRPPPIGFQMSEFEFEIFKTLSQIFLFFNYDASPYSNRKSYYLDDLKRVVLVIKQLTFCSSFTSANSTGVKACANNADAGGMGSPTSGEIWWEWRHDFWKLPNSSHKKICFESGDMIHTSHVDGVANSGEN